MDATTSTTTLPAPKVQRFLSAKALLITPNMRNTLISLLKHMEKGDIRDVPADRGDMHFDVGYGKKLQYFYYPSVVVRFDCGTAGCILGWARVLDPAAKRREPYYDGDFSDSESFPIQLKALFFSNWPLDNTRLKVAQAASALRQYLETGKGKHYGYKAEDYEEFGID